MSADDIQVAPIVPGVTPSQARAAATAITNTGARLTAPITDIQTALDALFQAARS